MSRRKCSACGHRMGVTHAQYTQCPANVTKNTPVSTDVPTSSIPTVDVQKMSHSSVDSAFMRFQALSVDAVKDNGTLLTLEDLNVLWNLTHGRNIQERLKVMNNAMATADPSTAHEFYLTILEPGLDDNFSLLDSMIESAGPQLFECLSESRENWIRHRLARSANVPSDILYTLFDDSDSYVREGVAANEKTPVELLNVLAKDPSDDVVSAVVTEREETPEETFMIITKCDNEMIRAAIVDSPSVTTKVLTVLAKDPSSDVRCNVAYDERTPGEVLAMLAEDDADSVRGNVAGNRSTPTEVLEKMASDTEDWVHSLAQQTLRYRSQFVKV